MTFRKYALGALASATCVMTAPVFAQDVGSVRLSAGASTLGATAEVAYRFQPNLSIRGVVGGLIEANPTITLDGQDYASTVKLQGAGALVDWHTGLGGLRISGGLMYAAPEVLSSTTVTSSITFGSGATAQTISAGETVDVAVRPKNDVAPILSIGYDQPLGNNWVISAEVGALFNEGYDVGITATNTSGIPQADLDAAIADEEGRIENDINDIFGTASPYVSVMVGYQF